MRVQSFCLRSLHAKIRFRGSESSANSTRCQSHKILNLSYKSYFFSKHGWYFPSDLHSAWLTCPPPRKFSRLSGMSPNSNTPQEAYVYASAKNLYHKDNYCYPQAYPQFLLTYPPNWHFALLFLGERAGKHIFFDSHL